MGWLKKLWDPGDWGSSITDGVEDIIPSIEDVIEDIPSSINDVIADIPSSITDVVLDTRDTIADIGDAVGQVVEAVLDKPIPFLIRTITSVVAPQFSWIVNGAMTIAEGGDAMDVLRSVTLSTVAKNLGTKVSDFSSDLIEDIGIDATLSDSLGNIFGKTLAKVGEGQDLEFAFVSNVFSELKDPLKGVASDLTELFAGANADISQVEQFIENTIDSVEGARNLNEAAISAISSDLSRIIKETSSDYLGTTFGPQFATALQAGLTAAVRNPDNPNAAEQAYYGSLKASSVAEIS